MNKMQLAAHTQQHSPPIRISAGANTMLKNFDALAIATELFLRMQHQRSTVHLFVREVHRGQNFENAVSSPTAT